LVYRADLPAHCPGDDAFERDARLFRACRGNPPTDEDYRPHNESAVPQKRRKADANNCAGWGLSVWVDEAELRHAREHVMPWMKRAYIFRSDVAAHEGRLSAPGGNGHHTYWPYAQTDLRVRASLFLNPEGN
jgi:hypothetical protein